MKGFKKLPKVQVARLLRKARAFQGIKKERTAEIYLLTTLEICCLIAYVILKEESFHDIVEELLILKQ